MKIEFRDVRSQMDSTIFELTDEGGERTFEVRTYTSDMGWFNHKSPTLVDAFMSVAELAGTLGISRERFDNAVISVETQQ